MAQKKTTVNDRSGKDASIYVPVPVRDMVRTAAKALGIPISALIAELVLALNRGDVELSDIRGIKKRYPVYRRPVLASWMTVERGVLDAVSIGSGATVEEVTDRCRSLSEAQVKRALINHVASGQMVQDGRIYRIRETVTQCGSPVVGVSVQNDERPSDSSTSNGA